jgi:hypothetical protein
MLPAKVRCSECRSTNLGIRIDTDLEFDGRTCTVGGPVSRELPSKAQVTCRNCGHTFQLTTAAFKPQIDTKALLAFMDEACIGMDWHEPPVTAEIYGDHLDNACGNAVRKDPKERRRQEFVIELYDSYEPAKIRINLASLLAEVCRLARKEG